MRLKHWLLVIMVAVGINSTSRAGIFSRKPKADPAEQVPALIMQLKTDKDEGKRQTAAEELRTFDPKTFPEIMTVLVDALTKDGSTGVRVEAASTIAKLRPINQQAGFALEQAAANDPSLRVRMAARQSLWQYHLVGYRGGKPAENGPAMPAMMPNPKTTHTSAKNPHGTLESPEPPLADAGTSTSQKPLQPVAPPKLMTPPPSTPSPAPKTSQSEGPSL